MNIIANYRAYMATIGLCLIFIFSSAFSGVPPSLLLFKSKEDRAKFYHYKAQRLANEGNIKKAISKLNKSISIQRTNEALVDLANLYAKQGKVKKAFTTVSKVIPKDSSPPIHKVELLAWKAYYALNLGMSLEPFELFNDAIHLMKRHHIDSTNLMSNLYNNSGVSRILYQTEVLKDGMPNIHVNDYRQAKRKMEKALEFMPDNCTATYNLEFVQTILDAVQTNDTLFIKDKVQHIPAFVYDSIAYPSLNCTLPKPEPHDDILVKLNKEKEVVFVLDISGSMAAIAPNGKTRFQAMKDLVLDLLEDLDEAVEIGLITLGQDCNSAPKYSIPVGTRSREELKNIVHGLNLNGSTPLNKRLRQAERLFQKKAKDKAIFLCSDGLNSCGRGSTCRVGEELRQSDIKVYAFSLLLEGSFDQEYAIYDCITKATYGELLGITSEKEYEIKTNYIRDAVYPLALKKQDLVTGYYTELIPQDYQLTHTIGTE